MKELERIIQYLDGDMKVGEKQLFELELKSNAMISQQLRLTQQVDQLLADTELFNYIESLQTAKERYKSEEIISLEGDIKQSNSKPKNSLFQIKKLLAAAAVIILVVISSVLYTNLSVPSNERVFNQYYQKYDAEIVTRSSTIPDVNALIAAIQQYDKGNYPDAITKFDEIIKVDQNNTAAHFFLGVSCIELHNYDKAIKNLTFVISQNDTAFIEHAEWYLALCYVKTKQISKANSLLSKIASRQTFYRLMATDVLKKLK
jgi:tetratricopeptide (TPR) repeat protein